VTRGGPDERAELVAELAKVVQLIAEPDQRKSFTGDLAGTLDAAGVNLQIIPKEVVDTLAGLSDEELALLSRVGDSFASAGLVLGEIPSGGRVWFF
jgi:hypothetical protein